LTQLGHGGAADRLSFRLVLKIAVRSLPYIRPVLPYLLRFAAVALPGLLFLGVGGFVGIDLFFNRVLVGKPLTEFSAGLLSLDPQIFVHVDTLSAEARLQLRDKLAWTSIPISLVVAPGVLLFLYFRAWILQKINQQLRVEMMERIQALSLRFHVNHQAGDSIYRVYQDSAMVTAIIQTLLLEPVGRILVGLIGFAVAFAFDPLLAVILVCITLGMIGLGTWFSSPLRLGFRRAREANSDLTSRIQMALAGVRVVKAYGFEGVVQEQFERDSLNAFEAAFRARTRWIVYGILAFGISGTGLVGAEALMALRTEAGDATHAAGVFFAVGFAIWNLGAFTAARERMGNVAGGVEGLANLWSKAQEMAVGLDRAFQLLDLEPDVEEAADAVPLAPLSDSIDLRGIHFAYEADRPVLRGIDLSLAPSTVTAIVGPTGSGKSTLVSLLLRLFDPDHGSVTIDGVDLRCLQIQSLRDQVSIALQENLLFGTSIRENIRFAVPDATEEEVEEAARIACADEFIRAQPHGYDTVLGERGSKLSTGQRQRIGIARALIKDAPILILDEPTAALDAETEEAVMRRLAEWGRGRAIVLITHRLSTVRRADQIVCLRDGRVEESGTHEQLMARPDSAFRRLVEVEEGEPFDAESLGLAAPHPTGWPA